MGTKKTRQVLSIFLASPTDVLVERNIALEVVNRFNKSLGPTLGWQIDLFRWEDAKPAYGRPQSIINPGVDTCDLFIGLLWERWGHHTGVASSGFLEEFERAKARRESSDEPEIWLVFKLPRQDKMEDPGLELTKVLEFREQQKSLGQVLFKEIKDSVDWNTSLYDWLISHILQLVAPASEAEKSPPTESPSPIAITGPVSSDASLMGESKASDSPKQLIELSTKLSSIVSSGDLEFARADTKFLTDFDVARLYLLSATWMTNRYTWEFLGTHEINLLYKNRTQLESTSTEDYHLLRTVLHDTSNVVPGWYWFRYAFRNGPAEMLFSIANHDQNPSMRVRALKLLFSAQIQIPAELWPSLPLTDESEEVSAEAIKYLGLAGDETALNLIEQVTSGNDHPFISAAAFETKYRILNRIDPKRAFSDLILENRHPSAELVRVLKDVAISLPKDDLIKGAETSVPEIVALSIKELARRGELPFDLAERMREDPSIDIRQIALQVIVNNRGKVELDKLREALKPDPNRMMSLSILSGSHKELDLDSLELNFYRTLPPEDLIKTVGWLSLDGPIAYKALALDHFNKISDTVRSDLDTNFKRIKEEYLDDLKSQLNLDSEATQKILDRLREDNDKLDDFIQSQYVEAALTGLATNGRPSDIEIGRKFLKDKRQSTRFAAAKIVSRFGDVQDVQPLIDVSEEAWGELVNFAVKNAIRLSPNPDLIAIEMAESNRRSRAEAGLKWLLSSDSAEARNYFLGLLNNANESKREQAVRYLSKRFSDQELEEILNEYLGKGTYYYNVVTWLDRIIYAPSHIKEMFIRDLDEETGALEI